MIFRSFSRTRETPLRSAPAFFSAKDPFHAEEEGDEQSADAPVAVEKWSIVSNWTWASAASSYAGQPLMRTHET